jgi:hypothetical protein
MGGLGCAVGYVIERYQEVDFAVFVQTTSPLRLLLKPTNHHKTLRLLQARVGEPRERVDPPPRNVIHYNVERRHILLHL